TTRLPSIPWNSKALLCLNMAAFAAKCWLKLTRAPATPVQLPDTAANLPAWTTPWRSLLNFMLTKPRQTTSSLRKQSLKGDYALCLGSNSCRPSLINGLTMISALFYSRVYDDEVSCYSLYIRSCHC